MIPILYTSLDKRFIPHVFSAFLGAMFISEIVSYGIFFEIWKYKNISPHDPAPFMSHMAYSTFLAFTSSLLLTKVFLSKNESLTNKIIYGLFFISVTTNLFVNGGRTGQVIFIFLIFSLTFIHIKHKLKALFISTLMLVSIFYTAYNFSPNFHARSNAMYSGLYSMIYKNDYTHNGGARASLWITGSHVFKDNFLLGTGIGNAVKDIKLYAKELGFSPSKLSHYADYHNIFVNYAAQLGVFGLIILLFMFYYLFNLKFKTDEYNSINKMFVISFVLFSFTHNTFHTMSPMLFFALFAGLMNAISFMEKKGI